MNRRYFVQALGLLGLIPSIPKDQQISQSPSCKHKWAISMKSPRRCGGLDYNYNIIQLNFTEDEFPHVPLDENGSCIIGTLGPEIRKFSSKKIVIPTTPDLSSEEKDRFQTLALKSAQDSFPNKKLLVIKVVQNNNWGICVIPQDRISSKSLYRFMNS